MSTPPASASTPEYPSSTWPRDSALLVGHRRRCAAAAARKLDQRQRIRRLRSRGKGGGPIHAPLCADRRAGSARSSAYSRDMIHAPLCAGAHLLARTHRPAAAPARACAMDSGRAHTPRSARARAHAPTRTRGAVLSVPRLYPKSPPDHLGPGGRTDAPSTVGAHDAGLSTLTCGTGGAERALACSGLALQQSAARRDDQPTSDNGRRRH